ncbi:MAG: hypothetical protein DRO12_00845, partial [Thermoprotei archaeon]
MVKEFHDLSSGRKRSRSMSNRKVIERVHVLLEDLIEEQLSKLIECAKNGGVWCGGWDLNPRRPTPSGPKPDPFDLA